VYSKCTSACVFAAAGATKRFLVHIGLHAPSLHNPENENENDKINKEDLLESKTYLDEIGNYKLRYRYKIINRYGKEGYINFIMNLEAVKNSW
jgi:hypothetical protein